MNLESLYLRLPVTLQNLAVGVEGRRVEKRRYGNGYDQVQTAVLTREHFSHAQLQNYRIERLRLHLAAASRTRYWQQRFSDLGIDPARSDPFEALGKLPIVTKDEVRAHRQDIADPALNTRDLISVHTSGTTGSGLIFFQTREMEQVTWATWWRYRQAHGLRRGEWSAYFGGRSVVPLTQTTSPYWRWNRPGHQLFFSGYHLSASTASEYVKVLSNSQITWIHGYPSMIALLATFAIEQRLQLPKIKVVTTGAESLLPSQKSIIAEALGVPVIQHYGQAEGVANISECPNGKMHVDEDYAGVEFVPVAGDPGSFRVIGTNWHNQAFPLIRYDTGDVVAIEPDTVCTCGRLGRVVSAIDGRVEDYIVLQNGATIGRLDHVFKDMVNIREAQIIQHRGGGIVVRVVPGQRYTLLDEKVLMDELEKRLGRDSKISIKCVDSIPRTKSGKLRLVIRE